MKAENFQAKEVICPINQGDRADIPGARISVSRVRYSVKTIWNGAATGYAVVRVLVGMTAAGVKPALFF